MSGYAIRGGQAGYDRLRVLAAERRDDTVRLLTRAGVGPGMRCLDLGCGSGAVTFELAQLVGPTGSVTGVDLDEVKLELARAEGVQLGLPQVSFTVADVTTFPEPDSYDVVYARALLQHLADPVALLRRMWAAIRPGGRLIVEDADFSGGFSEPPNPGYQLFLRVYPQLLARRGGDAAIGLKLFDYFAQAGIARPWLGVVDSVYSDGPGKTLRLLTLEATVDAMLAEGLVSTVEADAAVASLAAFTADPATIIGGPRIFQVWSLKQPSG